MTARTRPCFGGRRGRFRALTAVAAVVAFGVCAAACGGGGGWKAPHKGQAAVLLDAKLDTGTSGRDDAAYLGFANPVRGLTVGSDHALYSLSSRLVRVGSDRKATAVIDDGLDSASGLVALPHAAFAISTSAGVERVSGGRLTVIAGAAGRPRALGTPVPASAPAAGFHFATGGPVPLAARADGSLLIADTDVVWSLKDGRLTRLYHLPAARTKAGDTLAAFGAVDRSGTVYVAAGQRLADITAIGTDGTARPLTLPASVPGVTGSPAGLALAWLTGDGADGVYALATGANRGYVLHLHGGTAQLVARDRPGAPHDSCGLSHPVDATDLTCGLPTALAYDSDGSLYLGGQAAYVLKIAVA